MSKPLDMPDGPGWWAFEGIYPMGLTVPVQFVRRLLSWEHDEEIRVVTMQWEDDKEPHVVFDRHFDEIIRGKWYRLTMPWDEPLPTIPPDVRETLRETIQRERDSLARHTNERKQYYAIYKRWPDGDDSLVTRWTDKLSRYDAALTWLDAQEDNHE